MKNVLSLLEKNNKTLQALQPQIGLSAGTDAELDVSGLRDYKEHQSMDLDDGTDNEMEVEDGDGDAEVSEFKEKVLAVLKEKNFMRKGPPNSHKRSSYTCSLGSIWLAYTSLDHVS